ncbi:MAG: type II secretion system F family protein [Lachnospiraceae bacterium]|nr:type II secretion system F family protein [Lachnospiraceae bacterium]
MKKISVETIGSIGAFFLLDAGIAYLFYQNWIAFLCFLPFLKVFLKMTAMAKKEKEKRKMLEEFREMIGFISGALNAGYSLENAFWVAKKELGILYGTKSILVSYLERVLRKLKMNTSLEQALEEFARECQLEEAKNFAQVVAIGKKSGGNLVRIIEKSVHSICLKLETEEEIATMIAAKKMETRIMILFPALIVLYLRLTNGEYIGVLYGNVVGAAVMTVSLGAMVVSAFWSEKIMDIKV